MGGRGKGWGEFTASLSERETSADSTVAAAQALTARASVDDGLRFISACCCDSSQGEEEEEREEEEREEEA